MKTCSVSLVTSSGGMLITRSDRRPTAPLKIFLISLALPNDVFLFIIIDVMSLLSIT